MKQDIRFKFRVYSGPALVENRMLSLGAGCKMD
jgi:hypothetical protein